MPTRTRGAAAGWYAAAALLFLLAAFAHVGGRGLAVLCKLLFGAAGVAAMALAARARLRERPADRTRILRQTLRLLFLIYALVLAFLLFGDAAYGRWALHGLSGAHRPPANWTPLATIGPYVAAIGRGGADAAFVNLAGNLAAFAPMGAFLPLLCKRLRRFGWFFLTVGGMIALVEGTQLLLGAGVCDVDDWLLNTAGAVLVFWLTQLPPVRRLTARLAG